MPGIAWCARRCGFLFVLVIIGSCLVLGCQNGSESVSDAPSASGRISFQLQWPRSSAGVNPEPGAIDCDAADVGTVSLILHGADHAELARGGPWNCEFHGGRLTGIQPAAGCTAVLLAADPAGAFNYRALVNDVAIAAGQETSLGTISMEPYAIAADAGADQTVFVGAEVTLDGGGSHCDPAAPLVYRWELNSAPPGSAAGLTSTSAVAPTFITDLVGSYTFSLTVSDGYCTSVIDHVTIYAQRNNSQPVAHAGADLQVALGQTATLDGSASSDPENDPLSYNWAIVDLPSGSSAALNGSGQTNPTFTPDMVGIYTIRLTVNDGQFHSLTDDVVVTAVNTPPLATISSPQDSAVVYLADPVVLAGAGADEQDGALSAGSLAWSSSVDGMLGNGTLLALSDLSLGTHTLTLTATDSHGANHQAAVDVLVYYQRVVDTGQTQSFTDTMGEDADYLINPFAYVDHGDGTVSDNNTGLMWEQSAGTYGGYSLPSAESYCADLTLGGHGDWRMPDRKELVSIISYWNLDPSINRTFFNIYSGSYFTSDRCIDWGGQAIVEFGYGQVRCDGTGNNQQVRCVRGGATPPYAWTEGLVDNGNGTVSDQLTGLTWQQEEYGGPVQGSFCEDIHGYMDSANWETALTYCQDLQLGGHEDWRMPNIKELESITDEDGTQSCFNMTYFPHACGNYWSSTSFIVDGGHAYYYENRIGQFKFASKLDEMEVKCVRGGQ